MATELLYRPSLTDVRAAASRLKEVVLLSPLARSVRHSDEFDCNVLFKREDMQIVRSYKIRGAYNAISSLGEKERECGVICASAGNHAQGVARSCNLLRIKGVIVMPIPTPQQKVDQVKMFGGEYVEILLVGDNFDDARELAMTRAIEGEMTFIHPFDNEKVIEGQATVALELLSQSDEPIDFLFAPVGGGGLTAGLCSVFAELSPSTKIIGVEPAGAPSMSHSIEKGERQFLEDIDTFVDGAAVKTVGVLNFPICQSGLHEMSTVPEGAVCQNILDLYSKEAIVVEPAGALSITALEKYADRIKGKNVVCIISGGNSDITRTAEIAERALLHAKLKHYFIVNFAQRAGALREFLVDVLGPTDDITHFEYTKKSNRATGSAIVGIQLKSHEGLQPLIGRMKSAQFFGDYLNDKPDLLRMLI